MHSFAERGYTTDDGAERSFILAACYQWHNNGAIGIAVQHSGRLNGTVKTLVRTDGNVKVCQW